MAYQLQPAARFIHGRDRGAFLLRFQRCRVQPYPPVRVNDMNRVEQLLQGRRLQRKFFLRILQLHLEPSLVKHGFFARGPGGFVA